jgi:hypothetical protein
MRWKLTCTLGLAILATGAAATGVLIDASLRRNEIGLELGLPAHMQDDEEFTATLAQLVEGACSRPTGPGSKEAGAR